MKQKDIIVLVVAVCISLLASVIVSKYIFSTSKKLQQQVDVVPVISTDFPTPDARYFNSQAIDPTTIINIAPSNNQQPFNGTSQ